MANEEKKDTLKPGYVSWRTFVTFLDSLRADGVPTHIDYGVMSSMSGTVQSQLRLTLQFLGLIDDENRTQPELSQIAEADIDERKPLIRDLIKKAYRFLFTSDFDITKSTAPKFSELFSEFGLSGETRTRAESFFLSAAKFSEMEVSKYILENRGTNKRKRLKKKTESKTDDGYKGARVAKDDGGDGGSQGTLKDHQFDRYSQNTLNWMDELNKIIEKLPDPDDGAWTSNERERWMNAFQSVIDMMIDIDDEGGE